MHTIRHMVIPAAGLGTRLVGAIPGIPGHFPKEMLPIGGKAAIQHTVAEGYYAGIREFSIVTRRGKEIIRTLFEKGEYPGGMDEAKQAELDEILSESTFHFFEQEKLDGECGAIHLTREAVGDNPFVVAYPDNICSPSGTVGRLLQAFGEKPVDLLSLMLVNEENMMCLSDSGRVDLAEDEDSELYRIKDFLPKGGGCFEPRFEGELRTCGIYVALPHYFDYIAQELKGIGRAELTDGMVRRVMLENGISFYGLPVPEEIHDAGNPEGFWRCAQEFARS